MVVGFSCMDGCKLLKEFSRALYNWDQYNYSVSGSVES